MRINNSVRVKEAFLSTPSARRATALDNFRYTMMAISIHALREEGDAMTISALDKISYFYPRPPRGGRPAGRR